MGLSTIIGRENTDASRTKIEPSVLSTMHRLRTWDFRTQVHSGTDRTLRLAFSELDSLKDKLGLTDAVIEKTAYIYRKLRKKECYVVGQFLPFWRRNIYCMQTNGITTNTR